MFQLPGGAAKTSTPAAGEGMYATPRSQRRDAPLRLRRRRERRDRRRCDVMGVHTLTD